MVYLDPRLTEQATYDFYNSEWNAIYNEQKFDTVSESTALDDEINQANLELIMRHGGRGELLEIGFAKGYFLRAAKRAGFSVHGIELNEPNYRRARGEFGPTIHNEDLFAANLPAGFFDVIYMRDVFEHVPEPKAMLRELNRIAKPGCLLYIEVPNIEGLIYKIVKERHVCVFGFEHLNYWSPATLRKVLELTGFAVRETAFASLDFTVGDLIRAYFVPTHTTLYPRKLPKAPELVLRAMNIAVSGTPLRRLDHTLTPKIADWLGRGSVVKVLAEKP
jgi:2-polyprenyl-3-methyl-5-hydroxy-6-metoxy-1,4-benzoquinol methylase